MLGSYHRNNGGGNTVSAPFTGIDISAGNLNADAAYLIAGVNGTYQPVYSGGSTGNAFSSIVSFAANPTPDTTSPTLSSADIVDDQGGANVIENTLVTYTVTFSKDIDAATVSAADFGNAGTAEISIGSITESTPGVFTVQVTPTTAGTLQLQVNAGAVITDTSDNALDTTSAIADDTTLTVNPLNTAPTWNNNPIASATEDSPYSGTLAGNANDPDAGANLAFAKVSGPAWLSVATNGTLSGTPDNGDVGENTFTVSVTDNIIVTPVSATLQITVINTNDAPTWNNNPLANATEDSPYSGTLVGNASDPDADDDLAFAKVSGPAWLSVASDGTLSGTPGNGDVGENVAFTVSVTDNIIATPVSATLDITVINTNDAPTWNNSTITGVIATKGSPYSDTLVGNASDPDADYELAFAKVNGPAWLNVASDGTLSGTPGSGDVGENTFTVSVTDGFITTPVPATLNITVNDLAVIYEPFAQLSNATNDASLTPQAASGIGLTGNWATNGESSMKVANGSLSYGGLATSGNSLRNDRRRQGNFAGHQLGLEQRGPAR